MYNDNLARKEYYRNYSEKHVTKTHDMTFGKVRQAKKGQKVFGLKCLAVAAVFLVGSLFLLTKNMQVTRQKKKVSQLNSEYTRLLSDNKKAQVDINKKIDLKTVEELAISNYGMNRAKKSQIVYIDVSAEDYGVINSGEEEESEKSEKKFLSGLMAYLK